MNLQRLWSSLGDCIAASLVVGARRPALAQKRSRSVSAVRSRKSRPPAIVFRPATARRCGGLVEGPDDFRPEPRRAMRKSILEPTSAAVSEKLGDHIYSPIVRDSLSWLHKGVRAAHHRRIVAWHRRGPYEMGPDATSVMTHGWVDDQEGRVISIKYGPTEEEETDVEVSRDTPVFRMSRGDISLIKPGARVFAGAQKGRAAGTRPSSFSSAKTVSRRTCRRAVGQLTRSARMNSK